MAEVFITLIAYLLGSIPFGFVLTKVAGMGDIRTIGSGNIGATNVLRTGNKKLAAITLLLDGLKGTLAVLIAHALYPEAEAMAALAALLGHLFPVWLKFKGGKGVAIVMGILLGLCWPVGLITIIVWLLVARIYHYSSLAALVSIALSSVVVCFFGRGDLVWLTLIMTLLVFWKHSSNIRRLINGNEPKIGGKKGKQRTL